MNLKHYSMLNLRFLLLGNQNNTQLTNYKNGNKKILTHKILVSQNAP